IPALEKMVAKHDGKESAELAVHWSGRYPQNVTVWRDVDGLPLGFILSLPLQIMSQEDEKIDPAVKSTLEYLANNAPLRVNEAAMLFRFWMERDNYQNISPVQSLIFLQVAKQYLVTPALAFTFFPCAEPDFWTAILSYAELTRLPQADFEVDRKRYGIFGHDWRVMSPAVWIARLAQKEIGATGHTALPPTEEQLIFLSHDDFSNAVKQALQDFTR